VTISHGRYFLVERYVPAADVASVTAATQRLPSVGAARHIGTVVIVAEDTCLSVFQAPDASCVTAVNEAAGLPLDRIVEAEWYPAVDT
jgi:uncharacterized protein DUF4242